MAKFYRFNSKGDLLVEKTYDEVSYSFGDNKKYIPVRKGKKWGIALNDSLEIKVPIQYDRIEKWIFEKSQRLLVWCNDEFSIIDIENNVIIPPGYKYLDFENRNQELARASLNGKIGVVNKSGKFIIEPKYNNCDIWADNLIVITDLDELYLSDDKGIQISERVKGEKVYLERYKNNDIWIDKYFILKNNNKFGVLNLDFSIVLDCKYDDIILTNNDTFFTELNGVYYVLNNKNSVIKEFDFTFKFSSEHQLKNGKFNYIIRKDKSYDAKCGILNENYQIVLPIEYDWIDFSNDVWVVRKGRSQYILDENYNIIPDSKYKRIGKFEKEGIACVQREDLKYTFINKSGQEISNNTFDYVQLGSRSLLNYLFENINSRYKSGLCGVCINSKWGYVDLSGNIVIECKFDEISEFDSRRNAIVKFNGKWGLIDSKGLQLIDFNFEKIIDYNLESNLLICEKDNLFGVVDINLKPIVPFEFNLIEFGITGLIHAYSKKPITKKAPIVKQIEPVNLLDFNLLKKNNTLDHSDLKRIMVIAVVSGDEDDLSNRLYIIDVIKKDENSATFISGYAGGGTWDERSFFNDKEYKGEESGFTVFDYIREDKSINHLVGDYICEIDDELDEYRYKSLKHFVKVGKEDLKLLYSVWYNDSEDYTQISKNDKKRFKKLLKSSGGNWWKDWNFKF